MRVSQRFVFLVNAAAGTGKAPRQLHALLQRHPAIAARARVVRTASVAELHDTLRLDDDEVPTAVGGDGSFNALVTLMLRRGELQRPLALIPFGTGNATAHTLGLRSVTIAMQALERGRTTAIDIMRTSMADAPVALVSCSTGFESNFLRRYSSLRYGSRQWAGISSLLVNLPRQVTGVSLTLDGAAWVQPTERVYNVGLYNIPHYAFGKVMWRGMQADDGLALAASAATPLGYWHLIARGIEAPTDRDDTRQTLPGVRTRRWQTAELHSPLRLQVDGEFTAATQATLTVQTRAVTVICA